MAKTVVAAIDDLLFHSRVVEGARALGYQVAVADGDSALEDALADGAALVIIDLDAHGIDWRRAVERARERGVPVLAYGRHTEASLLRQAREAGCARVVPRSMLVAELGGLIREAMALGSAL